MGNLRNKDCSNLKVTGIYVATYTSSQAFCAKPKENNILVANCNTKVMTTENDKLNSTSETIYVHSLFIFIGVGLSSLNVELKNVQIAVVISEGWAMKLKMITSKFSYHFIEWIDTTRHVTALKKLWTNRNRNTSNTYSYSMYHFESKVIYSPSFFVNQDHNFCLKVLIYKEEGILYYFQIIASIYMGWLYTTWMTHILWQNNKHGYGQIVSYKINISIRNMFTSPSIHPMEYMYYVEPIKGKKTFWKSYPIAPSVLAVGCSIVLVQTFYFLCVLRWKYEIIDTDTTFILCQV